MIIAVCNQKGGVGKTTTAINLGAGLAQAGAGKILLIDFDPQANTTTGLGMNKNRLSLSVYDFLAGRALAEVVQPTQIPELYLVPATISLCGAEIELIEEEEREFKLRSRLESELEGFDLVIIDTPPSLGILTINALVASNLVIIPIQAEFYALEGLVDFLNTLNLIKDRINPDLDILGILLTMADYRTKIAYDVEHEIRERFQELVFHTVIHRNVRLAEAPSYGSPIQLYAPNSVGAYCYNQLAQEVRERIRGRYGKEERAGERVSSPDTPEVGI
ncbi:MAG: ParA family protein [Candidatus Omnitrophica bacterium]|nr:ParA family protein [Candidatus Omnitrophota bacterium]